MSEQIGIKSCVLRYFDRTHCDLETVCQLQELSPKFLSLAWKQTTSSMSMWGEMERTSSVTFRKWLYTVTGWTTSRWNSGISNLFAVPDWSTVCLLLCILLLPWAHTETVQIKEGANVQCCNMILNKIIHDFSFGLLCKIPSSYDRVRARNAFILNPHRRGLSRVKDSYKLWLVGAGQRNTIQK